MAELNDNDSDDEGGLPNQSYYITQSQEMLIKLQNNDPGITIVDFDAPYGENVSAITLAIKNNTHVKELFSSGFRNADNIIDITVHEVYNILQS